MKKGVDERGIPPWYGHVERMENDRIAKKIYVGECIGSRFSAMKYFFNKRGLSCKQGEW